MTLYLGRPHASAGVRIPFIYADLSPLPPRGSSHTGEPWGARRSTYPWWRPFNEHQLSRATKDEDGGNGEDQAEDEQPGDNEKGSIGSSRRRSAGSPSPLPSVSSAVGCPALPHDAPRG